MPGIDIGRIAHQLKSIKADTDGQGDIDKRQSQTEGVQRTHEKTGVFEIHQKTKADRHRQNQEQAGPRRAAGPVDQQAEDKAAAILADARAEAVRIAAQAEADAAAILAGAEKEAKEAGDALIASTEAENETMKASLREDGIRDAEALKTMAAAKEEAAIDLVIRELIG